MNNIIIDENFSIKDKEDEIQKVEFIFKSEKRLIKKIKIDVDSNYKRKLTMR